jgi:signal transduction histidine kinase
MTEPGQIDPLRRFKHDIANPLSALLAETQLALLRADQLDAETVKSLKEIEALARRMRTLLQES